MYIIRGIQRVLPGSSHPVEFERHKTVQVRYVIWFVSVEIANLMQKIRIEPRGGDSTTDSRKIVKLTFEAVDVRVQRHASL